jgi:hypothetical protein
MMSEIRAHKVEIASAVHALVGMTVEANAPIATIS